MPKSSIRARGSAALRRLREGAATPRRLAVRVGKRRVVASVDPPRQVARVSVRPVERTQAPEAHPPPRRVAVKVRRRTIAAILNRATGTLEVRLSRPGAPPPARQSPPPEVSVPSPVEPEISLRPLDAEPPVLEVPPAAEPPPPPLPLVAAAPRPRPVILAAPRRRRRPVAWLAIAVAAVALLAAGSAAAVLLTRSESSESAATVSTAVPARPQTTRAKPPETTTTTRKRTTVPVQATTRARTTTRQRTTAPAVTPTMPPATTTVVAGTTHAETKPKPAPPAVEPAVETIRWKPVRNARLYLFEVLREGGLGRVNVLQAWPTGAEFTLPDGLVPGVYLWSASPEPRRGVTVRSTIFTRAGRFRITESGRLVRLS